MGLREDGDHEAARKDIVMLLGKLRDREDVSYRNSRTDVDAILASVEAESSPPAATHRYRSTVAVESLIVPDTAQPPRGPSRHRHPTPAHRHRSRGWRRQRRQVQLGLIAAVVVILAAATGITGYLLRQLSTTSRPSTTAPPPTRRPPCAAPAPPVALAALDGLLLSPDQINTAMGATGMTVAATTAGMSDKAQPSDRPAYSRQAAVASHGL